MSDIRKRKGTKGTTYQVRYPSKATKSGYAYATFDKLKDARAFQENLGTLSSRVSSPITTVSQAVALWLDICEKTGRDGRETVEPTTLVEYRRRGKLMQQFPWDKELQELEPSDIVQFRDWMLRNKSRDLARRTLSSFHSVVIEMMHQGHIRHDPAAGITIKTGGRYESDDAEVDIPSDAEMRAILAATATMDTKNEQLRKTWLRYRPMIYLACFSGMRPSEYRGLPWSNVSEDLVRVTQRADIKGRLGPVKSKAGRRTIYLPRLVTDMLFEWKEQCPASSDDLVFPTASGRPQLLGRFRKSGWVPLMREAGLLVAKSGGDNSLRPKYTLYALRHYFASKLIEGGSDLKFIQETMGHSKIDTTLDVYAHLMKDREDVRKRTAEALVSDLLGKSCGKSVASPL